MSLVVGTHPIIRKQVNNFPCFVAENQNMPFSLEQQAFQTALTSSLLYAKQPVNQHYMTAVHLLLGVHSTIPHDLQCIEAALDQGHGHLPKGKHQHASDARECRQHIGDPEQQPLERTEREFAVKENTRH